MLRPVVLVAGTRAAGIKTIPVYKALCAIGIPALLCVTNTAHRSLKDVFELFHLQPDHQIILSSADEIFSHTSELLTRLKELFTKIDPALVLVQGDNTTSMTAALAAFYLKITVAHVEAGLRSGDRYIPFPAEFNRCLISLIASYHFAPSQAAASQLLAHGIRRDTIYCTGNTGVDSVYGLLNSLKDGSLDACPELKKIVTLARSKYSKIILLVTSTETFSEEKFATIITELQKAVLVHGNLCVMYIGSQVYAINSAPENIVNVLPVPLIYKDFVYLLHSVDAVITDSGSILEEAVSLGKHVLLLTEKTERLEAVWAGLALIVGLEMDRIAAGIAMIMRRPERKPGVKHVYGDGRASQRIARIIADALGYTANRSIASEQELTE